MPGIWYKFNKRNLFLKGSMDSCLRKLSKTEGKTDRNKWGDLWNKSNFHHVEIPIAGFLKGEVTRV